MSWPEVWTLWNGKSVNASLSGATVWIRYWIWSLVVINVVSCGYNGSLCNRHQRHNLNSSIKFGRTALLVLNCFQITYQLVIRKLLLGKQIVHWEYSPRKKQHSPPYHKHRSQLLSYWVTPRFNLNNLVVTRFPPCLGEERNINTLSNLWSASLRILMVDLLRPVMMCFNEHHHGDREWAHRVDESSPLIRECPLSYILISSHWKINKSPKRCPSQIW